jgi:hypothetical protein
MTGLELFVPVDHTYERDTYGIVRRILMIMSVLSLVFQWISVAVNTPVMAKWSETRPSGCFQQASCHIHEVVFPPHLAPQASKAVALEELAQMHILQSPPGFDLGSQSLGRRIPTRRRCIVLNGML